MRIKQCATRDMGPNKKKIGVYVRTRTKKKVDPCLKDDERFKDLISAINSGDAAAKKNVDPCLKDDEHFKDLISAINSGDAAAKKKRKFAMNSCDFASKKERKPSKSSGDYAPKMKMISDINSGDAKKESKPSKSSGEGDSEGDFISQCRPKGLRNLMQLFNDQQKDDVKSIGFGGILELQLNRCSNHKMLLWLVENFNCSGRVLTVDNYRSFVITPDDVYDVLMLPRNEGVPVLKYTRHEESPLLVNLKDKYGIKPGAPLRVLFEVLRNDLSVGGDDFKRIFVLYCLESFLTPSTNRAVRTNVLKSVESVENISKLDWCGYILSNLCESVRMFQNHASKNIGGCILLLQIIYFHRLKWQGFDEPYTLPLIQHWSDKKVAARCIQEIKAGKYGCGELSVNMFPLSANGVLKNAGDIHDSESEKGGCGTKEDDSESVAKSREMKQAYTHELENKVSRLEEEVERLNCQQTYTHELENEVSCLKEEIERLKSPQADTHEPENKVSRLEEEIERLKSQQAYTHELQNKVSHLEEEIERLKSPQAYTQEPENKVSRLEEEIERLKSQQAYTHELENKVSRLEEEIERLKSQQAYTHELENKVSCLEEEIEMLKSQQAYTHELENKVSRLEEEIERLNRQQEVEVLHSIPVREPKKYQLRRTSSAPIVYSAINKF
ncbi:hypothetical protein ACS0TY_024646 [Phlomoides rotata]